MKFRHDSSIALKNYLLDLIGNVDIYAPGNLLDNFGFYTPRLEISEDDFVKGWYENVDSYDDEEAIKTIYKYFQKGYEYFIIKEYPTSSQSSAYEFILTNEDIIPKEWHIEED